MVAASSQESGIEARTGLGLLTGPDGTAQTGRPKHGLQVNGYVALSLTRITGAGRRLQTFRALRYPNFRWFWFNSMAQAAGQGMQFLVLGWLTLDLTESASRLGLVILMYGMPNLDSFVERPVRDGPWSARVSGREAPRAVGC